jgi:hypothetical protein
MMKLLTFLARDEWLLASKTSSIRFRCPAPISANHICRPCLSFLACASFHTKRNFGHQRVVANEQCFVHSFAALSIVTSIVPSRVPTLANASPDRIVGLKLMSVLCWLVLSACSKSNETYPIIRAELEDQFYRLIRQAY